MVHLSDYETAQVLGLTVKNVKTQLLRARLQLWDALAPGLNGRGGHNKTSLSAFLPRLATQHTEVLDAPRHSVLVRVTMSPRYANAGKTYRC